MLHFVIKKSAYLLRHAPRSNQMSKNLLDERTWLDARICRLRGVEIMVWLAFGDIGFSVWYSRALSRPESVLRASIQSKNLLQPLNGGR